MVKAIIFDCFGVLVQASLEPFHYKYLGNNRELIEKAKILDHDANQGKMTYDKFVDELAKLADISYQEAKNFLDNNPPNLELLEFIKNKLKKSYKIGFLSNASDNWLNELFTKDQLELFDSIVLSYQVGFAKPDKKIFLLSAKRLNVKPQECVFIDDIARYCEGAKAAGMQAIVYEDFKSMKNQAQNCTQGLVLIINLRFVVSNC